MIVIADVFPKLQTVKDLVRPLTIKRCFRTSFDSQHVKGSHTLVKYSWELSYHIFPLLLGKMIWKISFLSKFEMIVVFVNPWAADYKYPVLDYDNFLFPIQKELS